MKIRSRSLLLAALASALMWAGPVRADEHAEHHAEHAEHGKGDAHEAAPDTYAAAIAEIDERLENIEKLMESKKLDAVHAEAQVIADVANTLAKLALKADSGVAKKDVKEINKTAKELAGKFDAIDAAGDAGDAAKTKAVYDEMAALQATLKKFAPTSEKASEHAAAAYACPMHCEKGKTYPAPGDCPVCGMHLKKVTADKFSVEVTAENGAIEAGKPAQLHFVLKDPQGAIVKEVETVHEKRLHLLIVSNDLSWYAHEHPVLGTDGSFTLAQTFPTPGAYTLFHDFTAKNDGMQVVPFAMTVPGTAPEAVALKVDADQPKEVDGYTVSLDTGGKIKTGGETHLAYTLTKGGKAVTDLQPYLGAMGHLVIISADRSEFVHSHPHEGGEHADAAKNGPKVDFEAHFKKPGIYKGWAQFQHMDKVLTIPFTFEVEQGADTAAPAEHHHHKD